MRSAEKMLSWSRNGCVTVSVLLGRVGLRVSALKEKSGAVLVPLQIWGNLVCKSPMLRIQNQVHWTKPKIHPPWDPVFLNI